MTDERHTCPTCGSGVRAVSREAVEREIEWHLTRARECEAERVMDRGADHREAADRLTRLLDDERSDG